MLRAIAIRDEQMVAMMSQQEQLTLEVAKLRQSLESVKEKQVGVREIGSTHSTSTGAVKVRATSEVVEDSESPRVVRNLVKKVEEVTAQFGKIVESVGLPGWSGKGYRSADGNRYTGVAAFEAFVTDVLSGTIEIEPAF